MSRCSQRSFAAVRDEVAETAKLLFNVFLQGGAGAAEGEQTSPTSASFPRQGERELPRPPARLPAAGHRAAPETGSLLGHGQSPRRCVALRSLPFPPPRWVWFAFAGTFDASSRFFIGTEKKKKGGRRDVTSRGKGTSLAPSPSLSFHRAPGFPVAAAAAMRWGKEKERNRVVPRCLPHRPSLQSRSCMSVRWQHLPPVLPRFPQRQKGAQGASPSRLRALRAPGQGTASQKQERCRCPPFPWFLSTLGFSFSVYPAGMPPPSSLPPFLQQPPPFTPCSWGTEKVSCSNRMSQAPNSVIISAAQLPASSLRGFSQQLLLCHLSIISRYYSV